MTSFCAEAFSVAVNINTECDPKQYTTEVHQVSKLTALAAKEAAAQLHQIPTGLLAECGLREIEATGLGPFLSDEDAVKEEQKAHYLLDVPVKCMNTVHSLLWCADNSKHSALTGTGRWNSSGAGGGVQAAD